MWAALTGLVSLAVAIGLWRVQQLGKRRMEVAEEALVAFHQAAEALRAVRRPFETASAMAATRQRRGEDPKAEPSRGDYYITKLDRIGQFSDETARLKKTEILARYFLGEDAGAALWELEAAWRDVFGAAYSLAGMDDPMGSGLQGLRQTVVNSLIEPDPI